MKRLLSIVTLLSLACGIQAQSRPSESAFDARAMEWLNRTVAAYSQVKSLEQRTEFSSAIIPLDPPKTGENTLGAQEQELKQRLLLQMVRPNKLRLESTEPDSFGRIQTTQTVCDGKFFWTSLPEKNWYTKEKAPRSLAEFAKLKNMNSGSLEMLMLMDINPFVTIKKTATEIRDEGDETLRETPVHWVRIVMDEPNEQTLLRIAIGKADGLIRRVVHERIPNITRGETRPVDDGLDALKNARRVVLPGDASQQPPDQTAPPRMKTRLIYDNFLTTAPNLAFDVFFFTIPTNALLYGEPIDAKKRKESDIIKSLKQRAESIRSQIKKPR